MRLHAAVAAGEPDAMLRTAGALLDGGEPLSADLVARVFAARMTGLILTNQAAAARREFRQYRSRLGNALSTQALFRFLLAQADRVPGAAVTKIDRQVTKPGR